jgi:Amt family ammonium transporter
MQSIRWIWIVVWGFVLWGSTMHPVWAETEAANPINSGDTSWVLISSALVLLMTPGLAFFYGGLVRSRNVLNTMMMSLVAMALVGVTWILWGYSLAFEDRAFSDLSEV